MHNENWIITMTQQLVMEVTDWMAGIPLICCSEPPPNMHKDQMDSILICVGGKNKIFVQLRADPKMLFRLAQKISGCDLKDQEEVREYAMEYVNVLGGRFISHGFSNLKEKTRYFFPKYETPPNITAVDKKEGAVSLFFLSELQECAVFSWAVEQDETYNEEE